MRRGVAARWCARSRGGGALIASPGTPGDGPIGDRMGSPIGQRLLMTRHRHFRFQEATNAGTSGDQRIRPDRAKRVPRRPGPGRGSGRRDRVGGGERPDGRADAGAPAQVRLDPGSVSGCGACSRRERAGGGWRGAEGAGRARSGGAALGGAGGRRGDRVDGAVSRPRQRGQAPGAGREEGDHLGAGDRSGRDGRPGRELRRGRTTATRTT